MNPFTSHAEILTARGCSTRRALWLAAAICLCLSGCTTKPGATWWNPTTWGSDKEATAQARAQKLSAEKREAVLREAQKATAETGEALAAAPASRPVAVAVESNQAAGDLLGQALGGLTLEEQTKLRARVAALLSENEAIRAAAETDRTAARASAAELSKELAAAKAAEAKATADLAAAFARENALANEARNARLQKIALGVLSAAGIALSLYLKYGGSMIPAKAIGAALASGDKDTPAKSQAARDLLDDFLNRSEQSSIFSQAVKAAAKLR